MISNEHHVVMEVVADSMELEHGRARRERFDSNWDFFDAHADEIYATHRGKVVCVAGQELFVADTPAEVLAIARAAHPEDDGLFTRIIPLERIARIYGYSGCLVPVR